MFDISMDSFRTLGKVNNYDLKLLSEIDYVVQKIKRRLRIIKGEWFLDANAGISYYEDVLVKNPDLAKIKILYIRALQEITEITQIEKLDMTLDSAKRKLNINIELIVNNELVSIEL